MNFESSQDGKEKGFVTFAERALKRFKSLQLGPQPWPAWGALFWPTFGEGRRWE